MMMDDDAEWDYVWYASSHVPPLNSTNNGISFDDDVASIKHLNFSVEPKYSLKELEVVVSHDTSATQNDPQFVILTDKLVGAKIYLKINKKLSFSLGITNIIQPDIVVNRDFHTYRMLNDNGLIKIYFDNALVATGEPNQSEYMIQNGICNAMNGTYLYKSIKVKMMKQGG